MTTSAQGRRWAKTGGTQRRILDAATEFFATRVLHRRDDGRRGGGLRPASTTEWIDRLIG